MATFVLVHGHYLGVWAWRDVGMLLESDGHRVIAASLAGMGERAAEADATTGLCRHVAELSDLLEREDLQDVVLVGHSYAGLVIIGVAARAPSRISHLVFLDALLARDGVCLFDLMPGAESAVRTAAGATGVIPPPDPRSVGLAGEAAEQAAARFTGVPLATFTERLDTPGDPAWGMRRTYIKCRRFGLTDAMAEQVRREPGWTVLELDTDHLPMLTHPAAVVDCLQRVVCESQGS